MKWFRLWKARASILKLVKAVLKHKGMPKDVKINTEKNDVIIRFDYEKD